MPLRMCVHHKPRTLALLQVGAPVSSATPATTTPSAVSAAGRKLMVRPWTLSPLTGLPAGLTTLHPPACPSLDAAPALPAAGLPAGPSLLHWPPSSSRACPSAARVSRP